MKIVTSALVLSMLCMCSALDAHAQVSVGAPTQVSRGVGGAAPQGASGSSVAAPNAPLFLFRSSAPNLIVGDTNNASDVFQLDQRTGIVTLVSVGSSGVQGDSDSRNPAVSQVLPDGVYGLAFASTSNNLDSFDNDNGVQHVYLRIPSLSLTTLLSKSIAGVVGNGDSSRAAITALAAPNRIVFAYASTAANLVEGDTGGIRDIFYGIANITKSSVTINQLRCISRSATGLEADGDSDVPQVSGDGRFVVFTSSARNLLPGTAVPSGQQVYLFDTKTGQTTLISRDGAGAVGAGISGNPVISFKGDFVVYSTDATNIIPGVSSGRRALVMYRVSTGVTTRINTSADGTAGNGSATDPSISANGRFVTFSDSSTNLVAQDTNGVADIFLKDLDTGAIVVTSVAPGGSQPDALSDGSTVGGSTGFNSSTATVGFRSFANNLVSDGSGAAGNVFASLLGLPLPTLSFATTLEAPADVAVSKRRAMVTVQQFGAVSLQASAGALEARAGESAGAAVAAANEARIKYDIRLDKAGKGRERFQRITRSNTAAFRQLPPGRYNVRYRVIAERGSGNRVVTTAFSPRQRVQVP